MINLEGHVAVVGAGSWGTALAKLLAGRGTLVRLWGRDAAHLSEIAISRENKRYLPGYPLPACLEVEPVLSKAVVGARLVVMAIPSHAFRSVFHALLADLLPGVLVLSASKGLENESLLTMTGVMYALLEKANRCDEINLGVLSGPSFAKEVAEQQPTAVTIATTSHEAAVAAQQLFSTDFFRAYTSHDLIGLEISGAMKNVIAIAAGICDGLGYGLNARAALITRGLAEASRLGAALEADPVTFTGLGGLGDLVLTCTGSLSRNRSLGIKLGQGQGLVQALKEVGMVAEGVKSTQSCYFLAKKHHIEMPILAQMYQILYHDKTPDKAVKTLFSRDLKGEFS